MRLRLFVGLMTIALVSAAPGRAAAQQADGWEVSVVPMYFWAASLNGTMGVGPASLPIELDFSDAADHLSSAFAFHFEASRGRWGVMSDLNFVGLESEAPLTVGGRTVQSEVDFDSTIFEAGASYIVVPSTKFGIIGGLRTYTIAPRVDLTNPPTGSTTSLDVSKTSANAFVGAVLRPRITSRLTFIGRADVGAGQADFTWSALAGLGYQISRWGDLEFGFKALGIDVTGGDRDLRTFDVDQYGPIFGLRLHWGGAN